MSVDDGQLKSLRFTPDKMNAFQNYMKSDDFKCPVQHTPEQIIRSIIHKPIPDIIPYAKLQLEEQRKMNANQQESLRVLQNIEENTANLYNIVDLIQKSHEQQDEIISIITEILTIATAKNKEEAQSMYRKVMDRITQTIDDVETLAKIAGYAAIVWALFDKLPL